MQIIKRFLTNTWYIFCYPVLFFVIFHGLGKLAFGHGRLYALKLVIGMGMVQIIIWLAAIAGIAFFMRKQGSFRDLYSFHRVGKTTLLLLAALAASVSLLVSAAVSWLSLFDLYPDGSEYILFSKIAVSHITFLIPILLFSPLFEEIIFRGIMLKRLLEITRRPWLSLIIQAVCFSLLHVILFQLPYTFVMGIFFGLVFLWTRSLWASILVHFINNLLSVISIFVLGESSEWDSDSYLMIMIPALIITCLLLPRLYKRRIETEPPDSSQEI